jgi:hypothetical protein
VVVQGQRDHIPGTSRGTGKTGREGPKEIADTRDLGVARGSVTQVTKAR